MWSLSCLIAGGTKAEDLCSADPVEFSAFGDLAREPDVAREKSESNARSFSEGQVEAMIRDTGPQLGCRAPWCQACGTDMAWSTYADEAYEAGWRCELCSASKVTHGDARWFCAGCSLDFCASCGRETEHGQRDEISAKQSDHHSCVDCVRRTERESMVTGVSEETSYSCESACLCCLAKCSVELLPSLFLCCACARARPTLFDEVPDEALAGGPTADSKRDQGAMMAYPKVWDFCNAIAKGTIRCCSANLKALVGSVGYQGTSTSVDTYGFLEIGEVMQLRTVSSLHALYVIA